MSTVFISSVVGGFDNYREAARQAVELMDHKPIMSENFGARPYSSEVACITEVERSDIYLVILGERYGSEVSGGLSVTQSEFRAARAVGKPILAFVQQCEMEKKQAAFKSEVETYQEGVFRASFKSPEELKDQIVRALRQLETMSKAISDDAFQEKIAAALKSVPNRRSPDPELVLAFLPQPERMVDIVGLENQLDRVFQSLCEVGLAKLRDGYETITEADCTGIETDKCRVAYFPNGMIIFLAKPTVDAGDLFSGYFAPPELITQTACGFRNVIDATSGYVHIGLRNMGNTYVAPAPSGNTFHMKMGGEDRAGFSRLFVPLTKDAYEEWIDHCVSRFKRIFHYRT